MLASELPIAVVMNAGVRKKLNTCAGKETVRHETFAALVLIC